MRKIPAAAAVLTLWAGSSAGSYEFLTHSLPFMDNEKVENCASKLTVQAIGATALPKGCNVFKPVFPYTETGAEISYRPDQYALRKDELNDPTGKYDKIDGPHRVYTLLSSQEFRRHMSKEQAHEKKYKSSRFNSYRGFGCNACNCFGSYWQEIAGTLASKKIQSFQYSYSLNIRLYVRTLSVYNL